MSSTIGMLAVLACAALPRAADAEPKASRVVTPPALDDVEHMCALLIGCGDRLPFPPGIVPREMSACVRSIADELASPQALAFSLTLRECGLKATSCAELRRCALHGVGSDACAGRGKNGSVDHCDAEGRAISCANERITAVRDCPRGGEQCAVTGGRATCALGPCEADAPATCSASGTRILECKKGRLTSLDCAAFGLTCATTSAGPKCTTQGASCNDGTTRCDGPGQAIGCLHGHEAKVDCSAAGMTCGAGTASKGPTVGACALPPSDAGTCDPATDKPKCEGTSLRYCAFGAWRTYACKTVGFARCTTDGGARCEG